MCYINKIKTGLLNLFYKMKISFKKIFFNILKIIFILTLVFLFLLVSVLFFKYCNIQNPSDIQSQEIYICGISLGNWCSWITLIGLLFTALWSMHQYKKNRNLKQQEKSSEIAQDFANNLIEKMGIISDVLMNNQEIKKIIKELDTTKLNQFTILEMKDIYKNQKSIELYFDILNSKATQKRYTKLLNQRYNEKEKEIFSSRFTLLIEKTLNELEAICISISSKAAGSQFIYESLHQMFLNTVEILAIRISIANNNNVDKYYMNIISVYNMWNIQKEKDIKKLNKTNKKILKLEDKADKEIKKLLNKQTKTV